MMRSAFFLGSFITLAVLAGPAGAQLGTLEQTPDTPAACNGMLAKSKAALSQAKLTAEQKDIVDRAIRWGELWKVQADGGLGSPGYRRCMISLRPAQVLLKIPA
jgi:hypothetical protein